MSTFIKQFEEQTGLKFQEKGEIGFGRPCVGIINEATESYISYDESHNHPGMVHEVAVMTQPHKAYHKGPYLAVLYDGTEIDRVRAIKDLDQWLEKILFAGFEMHKYLETNSIAALMNGGSVTQKCLGGGIEYSKFKEVFQK